MKNMGLLLLAVLTSIGMRAQDGETTLLDLCEKNTSSTYKTYSKNISLAQGKTLQVRTARYTDFYPTLSGKGSLQIYSGGERTYLGNHSDKSYPNWSSFTGTVDVYPYKEVESSCGFYGIIMNTNGKSYSPEDANPASKINTLLNNNKLTLHDGAAMATEKSAAGIRIGELNTEAGSRIYGYYKSQSATSTAYYLVGALNTDATLAGRIASIEKNGTPDASQSVGIVKEGKGTYTITGNDNQLSGALRINDGTVLICNDIVTARQKKLSGATGTAADASMPVAYVFKNGKLGGTGNVGGHVDLYGTLAPGVDGQGTLYLANYVNGKACNLTVHPASVISLQIKDAEHYTSLIVDGQIVRSDMGQDFVTSTSKSRIAVELAEDYEVKVGDSFTLLSATKGRDNAGLWDFSITLPQHLTWSVGNSISDDGTYSLTLTCTSVDENDNDNDDDNDDEDEGEGNVDEDEEPVPDMGISKLFGLRKYLELAGTGKCIGVAVPSSWTFNVPANPSSDVSGLISKNFNLCVAENEMKMDAMEPQQNGFYYDPAMALSRYAKSKNMELRGHTLVWHSQVPEWISKDGKTNDKGWTRQQLLKILENHITQIVSHMGTDISEWDVVNETLDDDQSIVRTNPNGYQLRRESVWVKTIGEDFIDSAFVYAHRANPEARLYLNDYGAEYAGNAKTVALYNLAKRLKNSGIPIDGVGLQCHLHVDDFDKAALNSTVQRYQELGMNCILTEVDMALYSQTSADFKRQAEAYKQITEVFLKNDNCPHMIIWGINDRYSWIADKAATLFNTNNQEKQAYRYVRDALHAYASRVLYQTDVETPACPTGTESQRYNAAGIRIGQPTRGLNIVRLSNGTVRKELVR